jgi:hypothetical protein
MDCVDVDVLIYAATTGHPFKLRKCCPSPCGQAVALEK